jgi:hypothetical protein
MSEGNFPHPPADKPSRTKSVALIATGFVVGISFWAAPYAIANESSLAWMIIVPFAEPVAGVILAIIRPTRKFGLGVLLASGLGWLILGAMCAGLFR